MSNKFKKAVQDRAVELVTAGTAEHGDLNANEVKEAVEPVKVTSNSILDTIEGKKAKKASGSNKSVYFPNDLLEKIADVAKEKEISENKLIVSILNKVLLNK